MTAIQRITDKMVSIHAPVWGATWQRTYKRAVLKFQSTHPCGVRLFDAIALSEHGLFQSTHPCGVRLSYLCKNS